MHTIKITRTGNSYDNEFQMKKPLISNEGDYFFITDDTDRSHKVYVLSLDLLMIEIIPQ